MTSVTSQSHFLQALSCGAANSTVSDLNLDPNPAVPSRPARTPVWFMRQAGRSLPEYKQVRGNTTMMQACLNPEMTCEITMQPVRRYGVDAAIFFSDIITPLHLAGVRVDIKPGVGPVFENPVRTASDVEKLIQHDDFDSTVIEQAAALVCAELSPHTPLIGFAGAPFTLAAYLVEGGPSKNYLRTRALAYTDPKSWHKLAAWCAKLSTKFLLAQVKGGARAIQLFDSWVGNLSVQEYKNNCLPYSQQIFSDLRRTGINGIHFGVGTAHLLEQLQAANPAVVGIDWRTPLDQAVRILRESAARRTAELGADKARPVAVQGNLDPAVLRCPPKLVFEQVNAVLRQGLTADAHIFNLGHGVPPDTDPGVLAAIVELVHEFDLAAALTESAGTQTRPVAPAAETEAEDKLSVPSESTEASAPKAQTESQKVTVTNPKAKPSTKPKLTDLNRVDALFLGGGLAALTGAYQLQKQGAKVAIVEERGRPGGLICSGNFDDFSFDIGAEAFLNSAEQVHSLCRELGLEVVEPAGGSWIWRHQTGATGETPADDTSPTVGEAFPIPHGILGIPASYDDPTYRQTLSATEWERFQAEKQLDPKVGADAQTIAELVTKRFGAAVLDKIVAPIAGGIHSTNPATLNLDTVAPGLRAALAKHGSLVRAVAALRGEKPTRNAVCAPVGGMFKLVDTLAEQIKARGGIILPHVQALSLRPAGSDYRQINHPGWSVTLTATKSGAHPGAAPVPVGQPVTVTVPQVIVALPGASARRLLQENLSLQIAELPEGGPIRHVSLWVDCPELDSFPRGSGMLVQHPTSYQSLRDWGDRPLPVVGAKAITHYTAKWDWARKAVPVGHHLLRLSYGWADGPDYPVTVEQAVADAGHLLGIKIRPEQVKGSKIIYWDGCLPPFTPAHRAQVEKLQQKLAALPGLDVIGAWVAGSGIAGVVSQALKLQMRGLDVPVEVETLKVTDAAAVYPVNASDKSTNTATNSTGENIGTTTNSTVSAPATGSNNLFETPASIQQSPTTCLHPLQLGTRGSQLARTQSQQVADRLTELGVQTELKLIKTAGDLSKQSLKTLGGIGVFAATLRMAILDQQCELAVHSFKDLPTAAVPGLQIAAIPPRELINDCLCSSQGWDLFTLPVGSRVGTGSPRRASQLLAMRPDLEIVDIRGNVPTRLARVKGMAPMVSDRTDLGGPAALHAVAHPDLDAVILAGAGLQRLGLGHQLKDRFIWSIPWQIMLPAPAQGALAIETRDDVAHQYPQLAAALSSLDHLPTRLAVTSERAVLAALVAGCAAPIGAYARLQALEETTMHDSTTQRSQLTLTARVLSNDGTNQAQHTISYEMDLPVAGVDECDPRNHHRQGEQSDFSKLFSQATELGYQVAEGLLAKGVATFTDLQAIKPRGGEQ